jgi:predicted enzyme related to lactoylglutathione lyase
MKLTFVYTPVSDLKPALAFYRDALGWEESWREGDSTVALKLPDTDVELMLDVLDQPASPGPAFFVDDVRAWRAEHADLKFLIEPKDIPGGYWAAFSDPAGNTVYLVDQSTLEPSG